MLIKKKGREGSLTKNKKSHQYSFKVVLPDLRLDKSTWPKIDVHLLQHLDSKKQNKLILNLFVTAQIAGWVLELFSQELNRTKRTLFF